ncbi:MAG: undecaprenyl-diphosphate phosphatase [Rhodospirillales bacterium]|nr:undecaprenyl-diphosphate phosphatase [Alphaproteobacteria bacterium]USO04228.1 MAG: undecaprenyl-diphosphate phosphatase [Rhodospirillales bacterium]
MPLIHILILALVQGITEFLPVSSSGHLVLLHSFWEGGAVDLCWEQNRTLDIGLHVGTLLSVLLYYRRDVVAMIGGLKSPKSDGGQLLKYVFLASLPAVLAGFMLHKMQPSLLCLIEVMAWMMLVFGIVLWIADRYFTGNKELSAMGVRDAFLIGLAQTLALVPGTSRSGITMTAGLFLGFSRTESARFSLLLAIVAISGAGTLGALDLWVSGDLELGMDVLIAVILSFLVGWGAIALMIKWLEKATFTPFAVYRLIFGTALLGLVYSGVL